MAAIAPGSTTAVADIAYASLSWYLRGPAFAQSIQSRPLLRILKAGQKTFPGGREYVITPVQGAFMNDTDDLQGLASTTALEFYEADNILDASYYWKVVHYGLIISDWELKQDGISLNDSRRLTDHSNAFHRLVPMLENRLADFGESYARGMNNMLWKDGSQNANHVPGMLSLLTDTPATGKTGGLERASYTWWRHRAMVGATKITASASLQTLTRTLRSELVQLRRYGGRPNHALCGSGFIDALALELHEKGQYTTTGFTRKGDTDLGMATISMNELGDFEYDPTLDTLGLSKRCYIFDDRKIKLRPMEGEDNKVLKPERPYDYLVYLQSMTWCGALECTQLNANGVYEVA